MPEIDYPGWTWNQSPYGYDGVDTGPDGLLWYTHSHHTLAGGGASSQTYDDFRTNGPAQTVPDDVLAELSSFVATLPPV